MKRELTRKKKKQTHTFNLICFKLQPLCLLTWLRRLMDKTGIKNTSCFLLWNLFHSCCMTCCLALCQSRCSGFGSLSHHDEVHRSSHRSTPEVHTCQARKIFLLSKPPFLMRILKKLAYFSFCLFMISQGLLTSRMEKIHSIHTQKRNTWWWNMWSTNDWTHAFM